MTVIGSDDMGAFVDSGTATLPTQRPSERVDYHTLVPAAAATEKDSGSSGFSTSLVRPPRRSPSQRR